jgi:hypothetical protein
MKTAFLKSFLSLLFLSQVSFGQANSDSGILKTIVTHYYKTEKPIYKGRNQLLFFYCEKPNNNEEIFQTVNELKLPLDVMRAIKQQVYSDTDVENWSSALDEIYISDQTKISTKINSCLSLEEYQAKQKKFNLNNQRLMIVSKPLFYSKGNLALVKVVFYRSIEHNNGSVLLLEKIGDKWVIKDYLNKWST